MRRRALDRAGIDGRGVSFHTRRQLAIKMTSRVRRRQWLR